MAARQRSATAVAPEAAVAAARTALAAALTDPTPRPLFGTARSPGFFSGSTQAVKAAARLCEERGWLEATGATVGAGRSARPLYRLTAAGAREAVSRLDAVALDALRAALEQIGRALDSLKELEKAVAPLRAAVENLAVPDAPPAVAPAEAAPAAPASLADVLRRKYDYLRRLVEFQDGLVEIPRLYQKVREELPDLTVQHFHDELRRLWDRRAIELHILNEVRSASHPELGIRRGDALYYFVFWKEPS